MRERPILMKGPLVIQTLGGVKRQTRRLLKNAGLYAIDASVHGAETAARELANLATQCPYGVPGDRLWVRETWHAVPFIATESYQACYKADGTLGGDIIDFADPRAEQAGRFWDGDHRWFPGIHMPRWACRLVLEITDVRVERLNAITNEDAWAEGITITRDAAPRIPYDVGIVGRDEFGMVWSDGKRREDLPRAVFSDLWESINGAGSWAVNPWVWVVEFRRLPGVR